MPYRLISTRDSENWIKLSGKLTVLDFQELQTLAKANLERFGRIRILVELEGFQGWSREPGWEDSFFLSEDENKISKVAFVGDEKWEDEVFMFMGKEMRTVAIEFFPNDQMEEAKAWLSEGNLHSMFIE